MEISMNGREHQGVKGKPFLFIGGIKDGRVIYIPNDVTQRKYSKFSYYKLTIMTYRKVPYINGLGFVFKVHSVSYNTIYRRADGSVIDVKPTVGG